MQKHTVGTGVLTWSGTERHTARYGAVRLMKAGGNSYNRVGFTRLDVPREHVGTVVILRAKVLETRQSTHIGDLARGILPSIPEVGAEMTLGEGALFLTDNGIGVQPGDGRDSDWLDPHVLYKLHEQTVELWYEALVHGTSVQHS